MSELTFGQAIDALIAGGKVEGKLDYWSPLRWRLGHVEHLNAFDNAWRQLVSTVGWSFRLAIEEPDPKPKRVVVETTRGQMTESVYDAVWRDDRIGVNTPLTITIQTTEDYQEEERLIRNLRDEASCRIDHGANSNGHLEYVQVRLDEIIKLRGGSE